MAGYTREQLDNIRRIKATKAYKNASPRERKAAFEAALVESKVTNVRGGDRDSSGVFQQRPSQGWGPASDSLERDTEQFLAAARAANNGRGSAGQLAQRVQRSAFPGRYDQRSGEAARLVGNGGATKAARAATVVKGTPPTLTPGGQEVDTRGAIAAALQDPRKKMSLASRILENVQSGNFTTTTPPSVTPGKSYAVKSGTPLRPAADTSAKGTADFEGTKVAAWIAPALEYARQHGWKGKVNSGYRSFDEQTRIYNSGVRPAAKPGTSNHEGTAFPRGAVDVSDAPQLAAILRGSPYAKKLIYAGAKDPVHFSHPHGGGY